MVRPTSFKKGRGAGGGGGEEEKGKNRKKEKKKKRPWPHINFHGSSEHLKSKSMALSVSIFLKDLIKQTKKKMVSSFSYPKHISENINTRVPWPDSPALSLAGLWLVFYLKPHQPTFRLPSAPCCLKRQLLHCQKGLDPKRQILRHPPSGSSSTSCPLLDSPFSTFSAHNPPSLTQNITDHCSTGTLPYPLTFTIPTFNIWLFWLFNCLPGQTGTFLVHLIPQSPEQNLTHVNSKPSEI